MKDDKEKSDFVSEFSMEHSGSRDEKNMSESGHLFSRNTTIWEIK